MSDQHPYPVQYDTVPPDTATPEASSPAARTPSTTRRWLSGAALVAAGLVAGSGATYAVTTAVTPTQTSGFSQQGGPGRMGGGPPGTDGQAVPPGTQAGTGTGGAGTQPN